MLEDHSLGLLSCTFLSVLLYVVGLALNWSTLARQLIPIPLSVIPSIEDENGTSSAYILPVSLADWSVSLWGVVYVCQSFWLVYALTGICRKTAAGPAYNTPKLLPVQVHVFFCLAVLLQVGWLVSLERKNIGFALLLLLMAVGASVASLSESYRVLSITQPLLLQQGRVYDMWGVRLLAQNGLALFFVWSALHSALTFALFLTFGMKFNTVSSRTSSLVEISTNGFILLVYVLSDLTVFDRFSRFVLTPYVAFILFHAAQINKEWPDVHSPVFGLLAAFTAFSFFAVLLKVIVLLWRQLPCGDGQGPEATVTSSHPLSADMEEEAYLLDSR